MKYKVLSMFAVLCMAMPAFVSCGDDDDDDRPGMADNVAGTYKGTLGAKVMTVDCPMEGEYEVSLIKEAGDDDDVTVVLPQCSFSTPQMPTPQIIPSISVPDVDVTGAGNVYTIHEDDFTVTIDGVVYTGSITGTITNKNASINYVMIPGKMPMAINFSFNGTLK